MKNIDSLMVFGRDPQEISRRLAGLMQRLPPEESMRLRTILKDYVGWYGIESAYKRMQGRTVAQIFAEYEPQQTKPLESGELDGVRYDLYEESSQDDHEI